MRVLHLIFRSRLSIAATIAVAVLLAALFFQVRHLVITLTQPATHTTAADAQGTASTADLAEQQEMMLLGLVAATDPSAKASDTDPIAMIGPIVIGQLAGQYAGLLEAGSYSPEAGAQAAESIAPHIKAAVSYKTYSKNDIKIEDDTSYERMLSYRSDLREALAPLLDNTQLEFETYAKYVETGDETYLDQLSDAAEYYRLAAQNTAKMSIPRDALNYHISILNAMEQFAATLDAMSTKGQDAFASVALLRTYNSAEQAMFNSFDNLGNYYGQKLP